MTPASQCTSYYFPQNRASHSTSVLCAIGSAMVTETQNHKQVVLSFTSKMLVTSVSPTITHTCTCNVKAKAFLITDWLKQNKTKTKKKREKWCGLVAVFQQCVKGGGVYNETYSLPYWNDNNARPTHKQNATHLYVNSLPNMRDTQLNQPSTHSFNWPDRQVTHLCNSLNWLNLQVIHSTDPTCKPLIQPTQPARRSFNRPNLPGAHSADPTCKSLNRPNLQVTHSPVTEPTCKSHTNQPNMQVTRSTDPTCLALTQPTQPASHSLTDPTCQSLIHKSRIQPTQPASHLTDLSCESLTQPTQAGSVIQPTKPASHSLKWPNLWVTHSTDPTCKSLNRPNLQVTH